MKERFLVNKDVKLRTKQGEWLTLTEQHLLGAAELTQNHDVRLETFETQAQATAWALDGVNKNTEKRFFPIYKVQIADKHKGLQDEVTMKDETTVPVARFFGRNMAISQIILSHIDESYADIPVEIVQRDEEVESDLSSESESDEVLGLDEFFNQKQQTAQTLNAGNVEEAEEAEEAELSAHSKEEEEAELSARSEDEEEEEAELSARSEDEEEEEEEEEAELSAHSEEEAEEEQEEEQELSVQQEVAKKTALQRIRAFVPSPKTVVKNGLPLVVAGAALYTGTDAVIAATNTVAAAGNFTIPLTEGLAASAQYLPAAVAASQAFLPTMLGLATRVAVEIPEKTASLVGFAWNGMKSLTRKRRAPTTQEPIEPNLNSDSSVVAKERLKSKKRPKLSEDLFTAKTDAPSADERSDLLQRLDALTSNSEVHVDPDTLQTATNTQPTLTTAYDVATSTHGAGEMEVATPPSTPPIEPAKRTTPTVH